MFKKLYDWTQSNRARLGEIGVTFSLVWLWVTLVLAAIGVVMLNVSGAVGVEDLGARLYEGLLPFGMKSLFAEASLNGSLFLIFLTTVVLAPLIEETFRAGLCELCTDDKTGGVKHVFVLLAGSFLGFGLLHGGGYFSILIQGSLGLLLGRLWFRTIKAADGSSSKLWAYFANVFVHAAYNFCILGVQLQILQSHLSNGS